MTQSLSRVLIHTVFSTKNRSPFLSDLGLRAEMHSFLGATAKTLGCLPLRVGGVSDHVHLLTTLSRTRSLADVVKECKRVSTGWTHQRPGFSRDFRWQSGYGAFSVSQSQVEPVLAYIENQEEHHQKMTFQDELRELLRRHGIDFDERYLWD